MSKPQIWQPQAREGAESQTSPDYLQLAFRMKAAADRVIDTAAGAIHFEVDGNPIPKARAITRFQDGQPVRTFTPRRTYDYEQRVAWAARRAMAGRDPLAGPVAVELRFFRKDRAPCDFDNLAKGVLDAVQESEDTPGGICFQDDRQIVEAHVYKGVDPDNPRAEIRVWSASCPQGE